MNLHGPLLTGRTLLLLALAILAGPALGQERSMNLVPLEKFIQFQRGIRSLQANFVETRSMRTLRTAGGGQGTIYMAGATKFRWQTAGDPPRSIAIRNGSTFWLIQPQAKRAEKRTVSESEFSPFDFAAGGIARSMDDLRKRYAIDSVARQEGVWVAVIRPLDRGVAAKVRRITLGIDPARYYLRSLKLELRDGSSIHAVFTSQRFNPSLASDLFTPNLEGYLVRER